MRQKMIANQQLDLTITFRDSISDEPRPITCRERLRETTQSQSCPTSPHCIMRGQKSSKRWWVCQPETEASTKLSHSSCSHLIAKLVCWRIRHPQSSPRPLSIKKIYSNSCRNGSSHRSSRRILTPWSLWSKSRRRRIKLFSRSRLRSYRLAIPSRPSCAT